MYICIYIYVYNEQQPSSRAFQWVTKPYGNVGVSGVYGNRQDLGWDFSIMGVFRGVG